MLDIFRGLKNLIKVSHVHIDSTIFRLHYTFTVMCLLAFSLIVTTRQYVGNPIDCVHTKDIPEDVLNTYCWIHSTYTIPSAFWKRIGIDVAHPGIDKTIDPEERRYVKYYQWVCFCLFFQVMFILELVLLREAQGESKKPDFIMAHYSACQILSPLAFFFMTHPVVTT